MRRIFFVAGLWLLTCVWAGQSHAQSLFYKRFTIEDSLADNVLYCVLQDYKGRIWVGTDNGLSCLSEGQFTNYRLKEGLPSNYITALQENTDSTLWMATWGGGIVRMKDGRFQQTTFEQKKITNFQLNRNRYIAWQLQASNVLYNGQYQDTVFQGSTYYLTENDNHSFELSLHTERLGKPTGNYFLAQNQHIYIFKAFPGLLVFPQATIAERVLQEATKKDTIYAFHEDKYGQKWIALSSELIQVRNGKIHRVAAWNPGTKLHSIQAISPTQLVGWNYNQSFVFQVPTRKTVSLEKSIPFKSLIANMHVDKNHNIWAATDGNGLFYIPYPYIQRFTAELNNSHILDIAQGQDNSVYMGSKAGYFQVSKGKIQHYFSNRYINNLHTNSVGNVLYDWQDKAFKNNNQLKKYYRWGKPLNKEGYYIYDRSVFYYPRHYEDSSYILFISQKMTKILPAEKNVYGIIGKEADYFIRNGWVDTQKHIWLATSKGVVILLFKGLNQHRWGLLQGGAMPFIVPGDLKQQTITTKDGLPDNDVRDIKGDRKGRIWIATAKGICVYENGKCRLVLANNWLKDNSIQSILFDHHNTLWIATKRGLAYWDGQQMGVLNTAQGLASNEVTCLFLDKQNQLWVGGSQGAAVIDVTEKIQPPTPLQVHIRQTMVNSQMTQLTKVSYEDTIRFAFEAIDYSFPQKHTYRVRLDNQEWQETSQAHVVYSGLRAGEHTFQVQARNAWGEWSGARQATFTVQLPWRWIGLGALGMIGVMGGVVGGVVYRNRRRRELDKRFAALELQTLQAQLNPHFIFNSLNSIQSFILRHDIKLATQYLSEFATLMRLFLDSSKLRYITIEDELKLLRLYIELEQLRFQDAFDYEIVLDEAVSEDWEIPSMLLQPFVENAINHGLLHKKSPGQLQVEFRCEGEQLICVIDDDGVGRKKAQEIKQQSYKSYQSRAMQIVEEKLSFLSRLEQIEVFFIIEDKCHADGQPAGTRVTLRMPVLN